MSKAVRFAVSMFPSRAFSPALQVLKKLLSLSVDKKSATVTCPVWKRPALGS